MFISLACVKKMLKITDASLKAHVIKIRDVLDSKLLFILWQYECNDYVLKSNNQDNTIS